MKKKILFPVLVLVLLLSLSLTMAVPAMAAEYGDMSLSISAPTPVCPDEPFDITITLDNTGTRDDIYDVLVTLGGDPLGAPSSGDTNSDGIFQRTEGTWTWTVSTTINGPTTFIAEAYGRTWVRYLCGQAEICVDVIPCPGYEGLTPGFWKNHLEDWGPTGYSWWEDYFDVVFGVEDEGGPHITLLKALKTGGGGEKALGRHATAALLNATHEGVDYALTEAQVIAMVQDAYATGNFEGIKNIFEGYNELGGDLDD